MAFFVVTDVNFITTKDHTPAAGNMGCGTREVADVIAAAI